MDSSPESTLSGAALSSNDDENTQRFLQQRKKDMLYELRNIHHSHRPVTGQDHRNVLHQFMKKHICDPNESRGNIPANVDDVAEHRPQSVVVEVQGIVEQRPVSSVLQSAAFRHRLENIIRGSLQSSRRPSPSTPRVRTPTVISHTSFQSTQGRESIVNDQQRTEVIQLERQSSTDSISSIESFSSALSSTDQNQDFLDTEEPEVLTSSSPVPAPRSTVQPSSRPVLFPRRSPSPSARATLDPSLHQVDTSQNDETDTGISWNNISRVQREELVQELSELLHNRLVSSTLEGEFRATLEVLIEDRIDTNGPAVQQFVESLPGRIPRNDFSHLGIEPVVDDNSDNISIASISAHSISYTQTNTYIGRELQSLKSQMKEMMKMLKMTQELQMDVQRSIRQEVSAALANISSGDVRNGASFSGASHSCPVKDTHCLICLDQYTDSVLYQCGHMCVCYICGKNLMAKKLSCPVCRAPIKDIIRAYKTNTD